nr:hypothetical protein BaRGS_021961 [Batillaria attramentaria]
MLPFCLLQDVCPENREDSPLYRLKPAPDGLRVNFATCVWKNELYVGGGFDQSRLFAVYKPGDNQWDILPQMLKGREKHCMAALNWNVYVIGGLEQGCLVEKSPASYVVVYSVKKKTWTHFGRLAVAVSDTTAAVLGHRIYVFGGQDARGKSTDMVQCIDTISGRVYTAGRLPAPSSGARAVSDGGTIYIATAQGKMLKMKENFVLADEREREARVLSEASSADVEGEEESTKDCDEQQAQSHDDTKTELDNHDVDRVNKDSCDKQAEQPHDDTKEAMVLSDASSAEVEGEEKSSPATLSSEISNVSQVARSSCDKQELQPHGTNTQEEKKNAMVLSGASAAEVLAEGEETPATSNRAHDDEVANTCDTQQAKSHDDTNTMEEEKENSPLLLADAETESWAAKSLLPSTVHTDNPSPTVGFDEVGGFPARHDFGAYLYDGELVFLGKNIE